MSPLQRHRLMLLARLERLVELRAAGDCEGGLNELGLRLVDASIRATVADCREAGVGEYARRVAAWGRR